MIADLDQLTFDLNQMKNLEVLLVESIQIQQLENRSHLPDHLLKLEVRRSLKMLQVRVISHGYFWDMVLVKGKSSHSELCREDWVIFTDM